MANRDLLERITIDPAVCHGKPCVRGHRLRACIAYGSERSRERSVIPARGAA